MTPVQMWIAFGVLVALGILAFGLFPLWMASRRRPRGAPPPVPFTVTIEEGAVAYREGPHEQRFAWEPAEQPPALGFLHVPEYERWSEAVPWAPGRREEILRKVATEVQRQRGDRCRWDVGESVIRFHER